LASKSKLLFLIEDDPNVLLMTSMILQRLGYDVIKFENGEEALKALQVKRPHTVMCDFNLPGKHGVDVLEQVRVMVPSAFRILVTGNVGSDSVRAGLEAASAQALLEKPFSIKSLCQALYRVEQGISGRTFKYKM